MAEKQTKKRRSKKTDERKYKGARKTEPRSKKKKNRKK